MKNKIIILVLLLGSFLFASNLGTYKIVSLFAANSSEKKSAISETPADSITIIRESNENTNRATKSFKADIAEGIIGVKNESDIDDAYDNVFHFKINVLPEKEEKAYLEYDLYGYDQTASISRSLNNQVSIGGQFLSHNRDWTKQSELLSEKSLRIGDNVLLFTAPDSISNLYKVRNVRIVYKVSPTSSDFILLRSEHKLYIKGANFPSKIKKMTIGGVSIDVNQPEFELVLESRTVGSSILVTKETRSGMVLKERLETSQFLKVDYFREIEKAKEGISSSINFEIENKLIYKDFSAVFPVGSLKNNISVSVRGLRKIDIAPLNSSMINVTGGTTAGFRLLPHGTIFEKAVTLSLPYDKKAIPEGYTEQDINIFYFDENKRLWQEITKDSLDIKQGIIKAKTTHFTDFIAGIIKIPESPETSGYMPTSIKDLKAASPLVGIQSIAPPSANGRGTASTSFTIVIPKGRSGMQPSLNLQYDSDGGHSWSGLGWDISVPSINIDTRWGAPRYDESQETETYSLSGEQLLPNAHRLQWVGRTTDKQFYPRREGSFQQIIRKGSSPKNYYWVVKDKSGVASYYGGTTSGLSSKGILQDANGNIGHWALCFQVDLRGNSISYEYDKREGELYLKKIYYTGFGSEKGNYNVTFVKNSDLGEAPRLDVQVSARLGFKQLSNQLLRKIEVRYKNDMIRSYELKYKEGAFRKTLLESISEYDSASKLFYTNKLDYFDDVRDASGKYNPFGPEQNWSVPNDNIKQGFTGIKGFEGNNTLAGSTIGKSKGIDYRLGVGLPSGLFKSNTVGAHGSNNSGESETSILLQDIDGDSYPDKVFKKGNTIYYRKNLHATQPNSFGEAVVIQGINNLGVNKSKSFSWGVDVSIGGGMASANIGYDEQQSTNRTLSYFMDFNGDGLVDFVNNGKVYYNRIQGGVPVFKSSSSGTASPVQGGGDLLLTAPDFTQELQELLDKNPLHDVVRVWRAPVKGTITIDQSFQLLEDTSEERQAYKTRDGMDKADGVHLYFQKGNRLIWDKVITALDYSQTVKPTQRFNVEKGERLYFRVSSIKDGNYDKIIWDPKIEYIEVEQKTGTISRLESIEETDKDANLISLKSFQASSDFIANGANPIVVPKAGEISFSGEFKKPVTSDHITLKIIKNVIDTGIETILYEYKFLASEVVNFDFSSLRFSIPEDNALITTKLESTTNIDPKIIIANPSIKLPSTSGLSEEELVKKVDLGYSFYGKRAGNYIIDGVKPAISGALKLNISPSDYILDSSLNHDKYNGDVIFTAKQNGQLIGRTAYRVFRGILSENTTSFDLDYNYPNAQKDIPIDLEVAVSDSLLMKVLKTYPESGALNVHYEVVDKETDPDNPVFWRLSTDEFSIYSVLNETETNLGLYYKNWGGFVVNGNLAGNLIDQTKLKVEDRSDVDFSNLENSDPENMPDGFDTSQFYFFSMTPVYSESVLYGVEKASFIQNEFMGTNRLGEDDFAEYGDFSLPESDLSGGETQALEMISKSKSRSVAAGANGFDTSVSVAGGMSKSKGDNYVIQTMGDFNGDRFPDYIRGGQVQYTTPVGSREEKVITIGDFSHSSTESLGGSISGGYSHGSPQNSLELTIEDSKIKFISGEKGAVDNAEKAGNKVSLGGNVGVGEDYSDQTYSDINGDGLVDKIKTNEMVSLNTGYGFLPEEYWKNMNAINKGGTIDISSSLGYSVMNGSFSGGLNYARSVSDNTFSFLDINGDGLVDKISYNTNNVLVELNMGDYFAPAIVYPRYESMTRNIAVSYGGRVGVSYQIPLIIIKIVPSFGVSAGASTSRSESTFMDMDADGNTDYVISTDEDNLKVRLSNIKRTNKLKSVTNGAGNNYVVDYKLIKPSYENPSAKWVLQSVAIFDGHTGDGIDTLKTKFSYENGFYDRREREFYGFGKIIQQQIDVSDNTVFSTNVQEFYNRDYFRRNLLKHSYSLDKNNKMRQESQNEYSFIDVATQRSIDTLELSLPTCDTKRIFIGLIHNQQKMYEGGSDYLETNIFNTYDARGNIIQYEDLGNGSSDKKITAKISYYENTTPYYGGIAKELNVFTSEGLRRKRATTINTNTGEITQIKNYSAADKVAVTDIAYDNYGNLQKITGPANYKDQRMTLEYTYDNQNHQYMETIVDAFGYQNKMTYDYRFGALLKSIDRNEQQMEYTIDAKGRIATIRAPYEIASGKPYTIAYEYFPEAKVPYAKTRNYDPELDKDIETYTYTDGLGRALQVKKTASLFTQAGSADQEAQIVSGKIVYDGLGRPTESYYPTTSTTINNNFSTAVSIIAPTKTEYDQVNRPIKVTLPDGSSTTTTFALEDYEGIKTLRTTQTDALNNTSQTYTDATGQNMTSKQNDLLTKFQTNALGEIITVTDAMNHITQSSYDWLGRRITFTHPDAGTTTMEYDLAGNLITRITQDIKNTVPNGGAIKYDYSYNRLEGIRYPKNPQNNVQYNYGKADGTVSRRGRLWFVQDGSGGQEFFYGKLGEVEKEIRTLRITPTEAQTYISKYEYDTWNRIQKMTYPDGEVVEYTYNRAGNLQSMQGKKENHTYDYIKQLGYDEFEQRKYLKYGNDTQTYYTYDPTMRRLQQLEVKNTTREIMNNSYNYDLVGNVLGIKNTAPVINNSLGGTAAHQYEYDDFYRLKTAKATYKGEFTKASYTLNMSYNKMHNITKKELIHTVDSQEKGYVLEYNYDNELHPNAPNKIAEQGKPEAREYVYDGNGNPTSYTEYQGFRKMTWDEENRLMGINDNGRIHQYTYDASGERVIKSSGDSQNVAINTETAAVIIHTDDYTGYVSPYFVIQKGKFTKHYFEGAGRIVSKLGNGTFSQPLGITAGGVNYTNLTTEQQEALDNYIKSLGLPPGPPTQQGIYASPNYTGNPYPSDVLQPAEENQEPPEGWPRNPIFNDPGDVPGPPVQFGPPVEPETVESGEGFTGIGLPENDIFYFHPDHLGSTSYISDKNGNITQHVEYIAFGEILFEEHNTSFSSPYLFNGKELDRETNLSYYGARYLDMKTSLWLSVDPLAEKYPSISPYAYVANNPLNGIDPDGREIIWLNWGGNYSKIIRALNRTGTFNTIFTRFIKNQDNVFISPSSGGYMGYAPSTRGVNGYNINVGSNGFLNGGRLTADPTLIAKVIMHEGLHSRYHMARAEGNLSDYPTLERHYNTQGTTTGYEGDHEAMAEGNIPTFVQGMKEFDASYGTEHSDDWYNAMAWWGSLSRATDDWKNLDTSTQSKYESIQNNEQKYMKYLDARATYLGGKTKANRNAMNTAKGNVDWKLYKQTRTAAE